MIFMIKGLRKNGVVMKCSHESPFESAFFILKETAEPLANESDILAEAQKLVESAFAEAKPKQAEKKQKKKKQK